MEDNLKIILCCIPESYIYCTSTTPQFFFFKKWYKWASLVFPQTQRESIVPLNVMLAVFFLVTQPDMRGVPCRSLEFCSVQLSSLQYSCELQTLAALDFPVSQLHLLNEGQSLSSTWVPLPCALGWRLSLGSRLGQL